MLERTRDHLARYLRLRGLLLDESGDEVEPEVFALRAASAASGTVPPACPEFRPGTLPLARQALTYEHALSVAFDGLTLDAATRAGGTDPRGTTRSSSDFRGARLQARRVVRRSRASVAPRERGLRPHARSVRARKPHRVRPPARRCAMTIGLNGCGTGLAENPRHGQDRRGALRAERPRPSRSVPLRRSAGVSVV